VREIFRSREQEEERRRGPRRGPKRRVRGEVRWVGEGGWGWGWGWGGADWWREVEEGGMEGIVVSLRCEYTHWKWEGM